IESSELSEFVHAAIGDQPLEPRHVHVHGRGVESHARAVDEKAGAQGLWQDLLDSRQRVAQVAPGLRVLHVSPQKSRKLSARMRLAERQGEIGEERLGLLGREDERSTVLKACFKSAKKLELQVRLGRHGSSTGPQPATTVGQVTPFSTVLATIRIRSPDTTVKQAAPFRTGGSRNGGVRSLPTSLD